MNHIHIEYCDVKMTSTSLTLGEHWETFIKNQVEHGRYGSASEVVRDALRRLEEHDNELKALHVFIWQKVNTK